MGQFQFQQPVSPEDFRFGTGQQTPYGMMQTLMNPALQGSLGSGTFGAGVDPAMFSTGIPTAGLDLSKFGFTPGGATASGIENNAPSSWRTNFYGEGKDFGLNLDTAKLGFGSLQALAGLWGGLQTQKLARESFDFSKQFAEKNLANQTKSYNDKVTDRLNARARVSGRSREETQADINSRLL